MSLLEVQDDADQKLPDQDPLAQYKKPESRLPMLYWVLGVTAACMLCVCVCLFSMPSALAWMFSSDCQQLGLGKEHCDAWAHEIVDKHMTEYTDCSTQVEAKAGKADFSLIAACLDQQGIGPNSK